VFLGLHVLPRQVVPVLREQVRLRELPGQLMGRILAGVGGDVPAQETALERYRDLAVRTQAQTVTVVLQEGLGLTVGFQCEMPLLASEAETESLTVTVGLSETQGYPEALSRSVQQVQETACQNPVGLCQSALSAAERPESACWVLSGTVDPARAV
jgi:hypothetical protein